MSTEESPQADEHSQSEKTIEIVSADGKVTLTQYVLQDVEEIFTIIDRNREHLSQHHEDTAEKYPTPEVLKESITNPSNPRRLRFAIRNKEGILVGGINITPDALNTQEEEIGYWQGSEFTGKGYVGRAVDTLTRFGFEKLGYNAIYGNVFNTNTSSIKVLKRAGYQETSREKGYVRLTKYAPT